MHFQKKIELGNLIADAQLRLQKGLPFVIYQNPNSDSVRGVFQKTTKTHYATSFDNAGFIFAPFHSVYKPIRLHPDHTCYADYQALKHDAAAGKSFQLKSKEAHIELVQKAKKQITKGSLQKVVLSKPLHIPIKTNPIAFFLRSLQLYTSAFCYLWYHPKTGVWLGASPEQLARTTGGMFHTTSLAGTLAIMGKEKPLWTAKEYEEQEMVTSYIKSQLKTYVTDLVVAERRSVKAGKLWHLKTNISGNLKKKQNLKEVLDAIHPTSAVCGLPKKAALQFILDNEGYDRKFYTGYLGELFLENKDTSSLFVNLRCMEILGDTAKIYVGGGITKDSDPQKEWEELENKSNTMLALLS